MNANQQQYQPYANAAAQKYNVPIDLFNNLITYESGWNPTDYNGTASGIAQFTAETAKEFGINPYDPIASLDASAKYLSQLNGKYGDWGKAVAAYKGWAGNWTASGAVAQTNQTLAGTNYAYNPAGTSPNYVAGAVNPATPAPDPAPAGDTPAVSLFDPKTWGSFLLYELKAVTQNAILLLIAILILVLSIIALYRGTK